MSGTVVEVLARLKADAGDFTRGMRDSTRRAAELGRQAEQTKRDLAAMGRQADRTAAEVTVMGAVVRRNAADAQRLGGVWRDTNGYLRQADGTFARLGEEVRRGGAALRGATNEGKKNDSMWSSLTKKVISGKNAMLLGKAVIADLGFRAASYGAGELVGALAPLTGVLGLIPAAGAGAVGILAALKLGTAGFGQALKDIGDPRKFAADLSVLAPSAKQTALAVRGLGAEFGGLKNYVQNGLFSGLAGSIRGLEPVIGQLASPLKSVSLGLNGVARDVLRFAATSGFVLRLQTILSNTGHTITTLRPGIIALLDALSRMAAVGSGFGVKLGAGLSAALVRFDAFIQRVQASGQLQQWIAKGLATLAALASVFVNLGRVIGGIAKAVQAVGGNLVSSLGKGTAALAEFVNSADGLKSLTDFFSSGKGALDALVPALTSVASLLESVVDPLSALVAALVQQLAPAVSQTAGILQSSLGSAIASLTPSLGSLATSVGQLLVALAPTAKALQSLAGPMSGIVGATAAVVSALAQIVGPLARCTPLVDALVIAFVAYKAIALTVAAAQAAQTVATVLLLASTNDLTIAEAAQIATGAEATGVIGLLAAAQATAAGATGLLTGAMVALDAAMDANPIGVIVVAVGVLGAAFYEAYKHSETFRKVVSLLGPILIGGLFGPIGAIVGLLVVLWKHCQTFRDIAVGAFQGVLHAVSVFLDVLGKMLGVLGHIPKFGWAADAANSIQAASNAAAGLANSLQSIKSPPPVVVSIITRNVQENISTTTDEATESALQRAARTKAGLAPGAAQPNRVVTAPKAPRVVVPTVHVGTGSFSSGGGSGSGGGKKAKAAPKKDTGAALVNVPVVSNTKALAAAAAALSKAMSSAGQTVVKTFVSPLAAASSALSTAQQGAARATASFQNQARQSEALDKRATAARQAYLKAHQATQRALAASGGKQTAQVKKLEQAEKNALAAAKAAAAAATKQGQAATTAAKAARDAAAALAQAQNDLAQVKYDQRVKAAQTQLDGLSAAYTKVKDSYDALVSSFGQGVSSLVNLTDLFSAVADATTQATDAAANVTSLKTAQDLADALGVSLQKIADVNSSTASSTIAGVAVDGVTAAQQQVDSALATAKQFLADLDNLKTSGASANLIQQVTAMGPVAGDAYAKALEAAGSTAISAMSSSLDQLQALAESGAASLASSVYGPLLDSTRNALAGMQQAFADVFGEISDDVQALMQQIAALQNTGSGSSTSTGSGTSSGSAGSTETGGKPYTSTPSSFAVQITNPGISATSMSTAVQSAGQVAQAAKEAIAAVVAPVVQTGASAAFQNAAAVAQANRALNKVPDVRPGLTNRGVVINMGGQQITIPERPEGVTLADVTDAVAKANARSFEQFYAELAVR